MKINNSDLALCRSALYEALALGFRSPTQETICRLISAEHNQALTEIATILDEIRVGKRPARLTYQIKNLKDCSDVHTLSALEKSYRIYFGHTAQAKVPPYETEYGEETLFQQPQQLGDIAGFYHAFGLNLNPNEHERVDHISCECEFLAFLTRKEAYAIEQNDQTMLQETRRAQKLFLRDHLARFAPSFSNLLIHENQDGFYNVLAKLANDFILTECACFDIVPGPEQLRLRPRALVDECFTCGSGEELITKINEASSKL
ncbi:MAG: molecular chaperone [bacterium]